MEKCSFNKNSLGKYILGEKVVADCIIKDLVREEYDLTGYKTIGITASNMLSKQAALKVLLYCTQLSYLTAQNKLCEANIYGSLQASEHPSSDG